MKLLKKKGNRKAVVALARKLAVTMHRMLLTKEPFDRAYKGKKKLVAHKSYSNKRRGLETKTKFIRIRSKSQDEKWLALRSRVIHCLAFCFEQYVGTEESEK